MLCPSLPVVTVPAPPWRVAVAVAARALVPPVFVGRASGGRAIVGRVGGRNLAWGRLENSVTEAAAHRAATRAAEPDWSALMCLVRDKADRAAFSTLFRHYAPRVKAFLMKSGATPTLAEECAQDVMSTVWQKAHLFDPARASVATWVFAIARNRRIDAFRRARRPEPEALDWGPDSEPDQAEVYAVAQETRLLAEAVAQLPDKQRALIQRAFYGDLSHSEIAAETGLPLGTIKSRIRLALDQLRRTFSEG